MAKTVLRTLLFCDFVGSTQLTAELGDARASKLFTQLDGLARDLLTRFHGREFDRTDGFLLAFERPIDAVQYALAFHESLKRHSAENGIRITARVGIHMGEVIEKENPAEAVAKGARPLEIEGLAISLCARVMSLALGGQTLLTRGAFDLGRRAAVGDDSVPSGVQWRAHGPYLLKGVDESTEIFEVGLDGSSPLTAPPDSDKARRDVAPGDEATLGWRAAPGLTVPGRDEWVLKDRLGEGGFGEVWRAENERTGKSIVLKFCYEAERLRALKREAALFRILRQALGERPDIAEVTDWNFDTPPFYLETEWAPGGSLTKWATSRGGMVSIPLQVRLELIARIADAVAAAHEVGVLHKDIKPANILILEGEEKDGVPTIRLIDFGIGVLTDHKRLGDAGVPVTNLGQSSTHASVSSMSGTIMYQAPELVEGKPPTVQGDVYSLGVLLYQVVIGDLQRAVAEGWQRDVPDDMLREDIAACVEGRPERRLRSAAELADRLRNLEARKRERAQEASARRSLLQFRRRRRTVILLSIGFASVALLAILVTRLYFQAIKAQNEEADARREALAAAGTARLARERSEEVMQFMITDLRARVQDTDPQLSILGDLADRAAAYYLSVAEEKHLTRDEKLRLNDALMRTSEIFDAQGKETRQLELIGQALELARKESAAAPKDDEWQFCIARCMILLANGKSREGLPEEALKEFDEALAIVKPLVDRNPGQHAWRRTIASINTQRGWALDAMQRFDESLQAYLADRAVMEELVKKEPDNLQWQHDLAATHGHVGGTLEKMNKLDEAEAEMMKSLELRRAVVKADPTRVPWQRGLARINGRLGALHFRREQIDTALEYFAEERRILEACLVDDPTNAQMMGSLAASLSTVGGLLRNAGRAEDALELQARVPPILEMVAQSDLASGRQRARAKIGWFEYSQTLQSLGRFAEAMEATGKGIAFASNWPPLDRPALDLTQIQSDLLLQVGRLQLRADDVVSAAESARVSNEMFDATKPDLSKEPAIVAKAQRLELQAAVASARGDRPRARLLWGKSWEILSPLAADSSNAVLLETYARALLGIGEREAAEAVVKQLKEMDYREPAWMEWLEANEFAAAEAWGD